MSPRLMIVAGLLVTSMGSLEARGHDGPELGIRNEKSLRTWTHVSGFQRNELLKAIANVTLAQKTLSYQYERGK